MADMTYIPFHRPSIGPEEIREVVDTLKSGWLTTGPKTAALERDFSEYVGAPFALAVNSCTAGLHLALVALGIGPGDEVITTPLTFCATVNSILHVGATPVLADIREDGNIDPASIEARLTSRTKAILPVHFGGRPCDMDTIWEIAARNNLRVIEDAAHAAGTIYKGRLIGAATERPRFGSDAVVFSFYATKNMTTGEGGLVTTTHRELYERMKLLCLHGISRDAWNRYTSTGTWYYEVEECGFKYNLSDLQSALGVQQLRKLEGFVATRTRYAEQYRAVLSDTDELQIPDPVSSGDRHAWHLYPLRLNMRKLAIGRDQFIEELRKKGIGTSVHFIPIQLHPFFKEFAVLPQNDCPISLRIYPTLVSLPLYPAMTPAEVLYVATTVRDLARAHRRSIVRTTPFSPVTPSTETSDRRANIPA